MVSIRFTGKNSEIDTWTWDCFVLPTGEVFGEMVRFAPNQIVDFRRRLEAELFARIERLLQSIQESRHTPKTKGQLVLCRIQDGKKTYFQIASESEYPPGSPEADVWRQVNSIFEGTEYSQCHGCSA